MGFLRLRLANLDRFAFEALLYFLPTLADVALKLEALLYFSSTRAFGIPVGFPVYDAYQPIPAIYAGILDVPLPPLRETGHHPPKPF